MTSRQYNQLRFYAFRLDSSLWKDYRLPPSTTTVYTSPNNDYLITDKPFTPSPLMIHGVVRAGTHLACIFLSPVIYKYLENTQTNA